MAREELLTVFPPRPVFSRHGASQQYNSVRRVVTSQPQGADFGSRARDDASRIGMIRLMAIRIGASGAKTGAGSGAYRVPRGGFVNGLMLLQAKPSASYRSPEWDIAHKDNTGLRCIREKAPPTIR
jgi:hypothetical protein